MKLDSARGLKAELSAELAQPMAARAMAISDFGLAALHADTLTSVQPTFALGVAPAKGGDYNLAVRVQHRGVEDLADLDAIRERARGEVDVRYVGRIEKYAAAPWYRSRQRPLLIGSSVGHFNVTAGTIGAFVTRSGSPAPCVLSNNHVLADENRGKRKDEVVQPGAFDGGTRPRDVMARLEAFVPLSKTGTNLVDAAVARVDGAEIDATAFGPDGRTLGKPTDPATVEKVEKIGRTTGHTKGRISAFELDNVVVRYEIGNVRFDDQLEIESAQSTPFSRGGDSGSLIVSADETQPVGLLFAGTDQGGRGNLGLTYANPLPTVLEALKLTLLP